MSSGAWATSLIRWHRWLPMCDGGTNNVNCYCTAFGPTRSLCPSPKARDNNPSAACMIVEYKMHLHYTTVLGCLRHTQFFLCLGHRAWSVLQTIRLEGLYLCACAVIR